MSEGAKTERGPRPIDIIRQCTSRERREMVVKEWDNMSLWFGMITTEDMENVETRREEGIDGEPIPLNSRQRNLILLVSKTELEDGSPAFDFGDIAWLKKADFMVVQRLINFMYDTAYSSVEEAEEVINKDPISGSDSD